MRRSTWPLIFLFKKALMSFRKYMQTELLVTFWSFTDGSFASVVLLKTALVKALG
jgi:hypothetical protein